jgi:hypothetical protein
MPDKFFGTTATEENALLDNLWPFLTGVKALPTGRLGPDLKSFLTNNTAFNPRDFGAVGDSVTDDALAFQKCMNAAAAVTNSHFEITPGRYRLTKGIAVPGGNIEIFGHGDASEIICDYSGTSSQDQMIICQNFDNITVRDFKIGGRNAGGVSNFNAAHFRVLRMSITGATLPNSHGFCAGIFLQQIDDATIDANRLSGNGNLGGEGHADICCNIGTYQLTNSRITNNRCTSTLVNQNIAIFDPWNVLVQGNECSGARVSPINPGRQGYGILLYHTSTVDVSLVGRCRILTNDVHDVAGSGIYIQNIRHSLVSNNTVLNVASGQDDGSLPTGGIALDGDGPYVATGNSIDGSTKDGICISVNVAGTTVSGNHITNALKNSIAIRGVCTDVNITGNVITNIGLSGIGSWSDAPATRIKIAHNVLRTLLGIGTSIGILSRPSTSQWSITANDVTDIGSNSGYAINGTLHSFDQNKAEDRYVRETFSSNIGDQDYQILSSDPITIVFSSDLSTNRVVAAPTDNLLKGHRHRVVRTGLGAGALNVAGLKTIPANTAAVVEFELDDAPFINTFHLTSYSLL